MEKHKQIKENIENQTKNIYRGDVQFYQLDRLVKIAQISENESKTCLDCKYNLEELIEISENISNYLSGSPKKRRDYENKFDKIIYHLKKKHKYYYKEYFTNIYSFYGLSIGIFFGFLTSYYILSAWMLESIAIFSIFFILILRQIGKRKDKKNNIQHKIT